MQYPRTTTGQLFCISAVCGVLLTWSSDMAPAQSSVQPGTQLVSGAPLAGAGPVDYKGPVRVIEGDTLEIYPNGTQIGIGLIGIQAAPGNTPCGKQAIWLQQQLSKGGLYLAEDPSITFDSRTRRMYYAVTRDNRKVALELVQAGVAHSLGQGRDKDELTQAENAATVNHVGCLHGGADIPTRTRYDVSPTAAASDLKQEIRAASASAGSASTLAGGFGQQVIASGFNSPTAFAFLPDGRILVAEKHGVIKVVKSGAVLSTPLIDLSSEVNDYWDHGLIGLAVDPTFAANGYIYLSYVFENNPSDYSGPKTSRVSRLTVNGDTAALSSELVILGTAGGSSCLAGTDCIPADNPSHTMGQIRFDSGGNLFITTGDGASFNIVDPLSLRAQDLTSLAGKVLRVTRLGGGLSSNPFWTGNASANQSKVWAYGVRNSFRFNLRAGSYPYAGDVGWDAWEEINAATKGANLGWPCYEGPSQQSGHASDASCQTLYSKGTAAVKFGVLSYGHVYAGQRTSTAAVGGTFYTATAYPAKYQGAYFYGDYGQSSLRYFSVDANDQLVAGPSDFLFGGNGPTQIEQGDDGNLYYLSIVAGEIRKITYNGPDTTSPLIVAMNPAPKTTTVALSAVVIATASELLDPNTVSNNFTLVQQLNGLPVAGSVVYDGSTQAITFTPSAQLLANTSYVATVKGGATGIKDLAGNLMAADQVWTFQTISPQPPPPGTSDLSSILWTTATNGWGPVELNMSNGEQAGGDGKTLSIRGTTFAKGLGTHAASEIHYFLGNACSTFTATIGIDDEVAPNGSVIFQVFGDGLKLYDSGVVSGSSAAKNISVNLAGKSDLQLSVVDDGDGLAYDHADWAVPRITCSSAPSTTITAVQATVISASGATITWTTNNLADSQVDYGTTTAYGSSTSLNPTLVSSHSQQLTSLIANTTYHFRAKSRDSGGTLVTSADGSFTTPPAGSTISYLSDMAWTSMTNGWGPAEKNMSNGGQAAGDGRTISIRGTTYSKGLGVHAASDLKYNVAGTCSTFISDIGIDDEVAPNGSVIFQVWADGAKLYDSGLVNASMPPKSVSVGITGKQQLELVVADDGDGLSSDHGDWAGARVVCGGTAPPKVSITSPSPSLTYKVGDLISYAGSATDSASNAIPASGLAWQIIIHHCPGGSCHTHPFTSSTGSTGSFTVPDHGDQSFFELDLTATDSGGLSTTTAVSIQPQTVQLTLATTPTGLQVIYGGTTYTAPANITTIVGSTHTVQVNSPQGTNIFSSWSDGGAQQHNITMGASNLTLTATFGIAAPPLSVVSVSPPNGSTGVITNTVVSATFSRAIDPTTLTFQTMSLSPPGTTAAIAATLVYDSTSATATLTPTAALQNSSLYTATVKGGANGIQDVNKNTLSSDTVWTFTTVSAGSITYLSDLAWTSMTNGWGPVERDMSNGEQASGDGRAISIRGTTYAKGLGAHAASDVRYAIPQGCSTFTAIVGVDDEVAPNGSVIFQVLLDGTKVFDSGIMTGTTAGKNVSVGVAGASQLALIVADDGNGLTQDHADWANAQLSCTQSRPPAGTSYLSDLTWSYMANGWGPVEKDKSNGEQAAGDGRTISIRGVTYPKGLGAHAASDVRYNLVS